MMDLELGRCDDDAQAVSAASQAQVDGDHPASQDLSERDVLGVVGAPPTKLCGERSRSLPKLIRAGRSDRRGHQAAVQRFGSRDGQLGLDHPQVKPGADLRPHQWRRDEIIAEHLRSHHGRRTRR